MKGMKRIGHLHEAHTSRFARHSVADTLIVTHILFPTIQGDTVRLIADFSSIIMD